MAVTIGRQDLTGDPAERVDQCRVELFAAPGLGHLDRGRHTTAPAMRLHHVGEMEQSHLQRELLPTHAPRNSRAVPAGEELPQGRRDFRSEAELISQRRGNHAMALDAPDHPAAATGHQCGSGEHPLRQRTVDAGMPEEERESGQAAEVHVVAVRPKGYVVTEARGHLRSVGHTPHPGQHRSMEECRLLVLRQPDMSTQPRRDLPCSKQVLQRLPQPQIGRQREARKQLGQADPRVRLAVRPPLAHELSVGVTEPPSRDGTATGCRLR